MLLAEVLIFVWTTGVIAESSTEEQYFITNINKKTNFKANSYYEKHDEVSSIYSCAGICLEREKCDKVNYNSKSRECFLEQNSGQCYSRFFGTETASGWTVVQKKEKDSCDQCYFPTAVDYRGSVNYTLTGRQCQYWNTDSPHNPGFQPQNADRLTNFCRDLQGVGTPWCYTMDPDRRWEFCPVAKCDSCLSPPVPLAGIKMQRTVSFGVMAAVYSCQYLAGEDAVEHCPVSVCTDREIWTSYNLSCSVKDCYSDNTQYTGKVSCTLDGNACSTWIDGNKLLPPDPSDHNTNYCRSFDGEEQPWCYMAGGSWNYCPVAKC